MLDQFLPILLVLEKNPLMSLSELSKEINWSWPTIKKRYELLRAENIIRNPFITYYPEKIGLQRINVLAFSPNFRSLKLVEQACREHPYTIYRGRVFGEKFGIFMQFNIPMGSIDYLIDFFVRLKEQAIVSNYEIYPSRGYREDTYPDLSRYDLERASWNFSWEKWVDDLDQCSLDNRLEKPVPLDLTSLKPIHLNILKLLSMDASLKQSEIVSKFNVSKSSAFRHYKFVYDNIVSSVKLNYNHDEFDLSHTYVYVIPNIQKTEVYRIYNQLRNNPPPFRISLDVLENNSLLLWSSMSFNQIVEFGYKFWDRYSELRIYPLVTKDNAAASYWFYPPNFDFESHSWRSTHEYMVAEPLTRLLKQKQI